MEWTIVAPTGSFAGVREAGTGEAKLDWTKTIGPDHEACTLSFAALEVAENVAKVPGIKAKLEPLSSAVAAAPSVTIVSPGSFIKIKAEAEKVFGPLAIPQGEQSFTIKTNKKRYLVLGGGRAGALYGAYELLNCLGFSWFSPDTWDEDVPAKLPSSLPNIDATETPSFNVRGYWIWTRRGGNAFPLWMARNKLNLWTRVAEDIPFCRKVCMLFTGGSHDDSIKYLPPEKHFDKHPEWYGLRNGKRSRKLQAWEGDNLCYSNPEVRARYAEGMLQDLISGDYKYSDLVLVGMLDTGTWCECDECKAIGGPTDHVLRVMHECRKAVKKAFAEGRLNRDVMIGMAAYVETKSPPSKPLPEDFDHAGTFITFFPIERCYAHTFADDGCRDVNAVIKKMYEGWANPNCYFKGNIGIGEYYNVSKFAGMAIPFISTMAKDIPYYYETGARQMCYMHPVVSNLGTLAETNMQMAAQLWDHTTDGNRYFSEFLAERYREMAGPMKRFYKTLEQAMRNCQALKHIPNFNPRDHMFQTLRLKGNPQNPVQYFRSSHLSYAPDVDDRTDAPSLLETMELLHKAQTIIDEVILECDDDAVVRKRLLVDARRFHYTHDIVRFYYHIVRVRMFENEGDKEAAEREARYLRVVGEGLRKEDVVTRDGCQDSQVLFKNGLYATYLSAPYAEIMKDYGLEVPPVEFDGVT